MKLCPIILIASLILAGCVQQQEDFSYNNGLLSYNLAAPRILEEKPFVSFDNETVSKMFFEGRNATVPAVLRKPNASNGMGVVVLPGAGVRKEAGDASVGRALQKRGFTIITIDARGNGESNYSLKSSQQDFEEFEAGRETNQALAVADALQAGKLLQARGLKTIFMGESMGGRTALVAAAIAARPFVGISTSGMPSPQGALAQVREYYRSFDSTAYAALLQARAVLLHSGKDAVIPISASLALYAAIGSQKKFAQTTCDHGYCNDAENTVVAAAEWAAGIRDDFS